ncbi:MAG: hypothetical protein WCV90_06355 [Candidatus Woesearchaeota archaeon]|jgi:phosphate uptake regulator
MRRKLIKQGDNALTLTLPAKWTKLNGLKAGKEVDIEEIENKVIISTESKGEKKSSVLKISTESEQIIRSNLNVLYRTGFDRIKVFFNIPKQKNLIKNTVEARLLGFEIVEESPNYLILENVTEPSEEKQEVLLRRIFLIIKNSFEQLENDFKNKDFSHLSHLIQNSKNVDRYSNFCNRNISKRRFVEERINSYWELYTRLLLTQHSLLHLYEVMQGKNKPVFSNSTLKLFTEIKASFELLYEGFSKKDLKIIEQVNDNNKHLLYGEIFLLLKKSKGEENLILYYCGELARTIYLTTVPLFAINFSQTNS